MEVDIHSVGESDDFIADVARRIFQRLRHDAVVRIVHRIHAAGFRREEFIIRFETRRHFPETLHILAVIRKFGELAIRVFGNNIESCGNAGFGDQRLNPRNVRSARIRSRNLRIRVNLAQNLRSFKSAARNGVNVSDFQSLRIRIRRASRPDVRLIQNFIRIDLSLDHARLFRKVLFPCAIILRKVERFFSGKNVVQTEQRIDSRIVEQPHALKSMSSGVPDACGAETEFLHQRNGDICVVRKRIIHVDSETADHRSRMIDHAEGQNMLVNPVARLRGHIERHPAAAVFRSLERNALFRRKSNTLRRGRSDPLAERIFDSPRKFRLRSLSGGFQFQIRRNCIFGIVTGGIPVQSSGNPDAGKFPELRILRELGRDVVNPDGCVFREIETREDESVCIAIRITGVADNIHVRKCFPVSGNVQGVFLPDSSDRERFCVNRTVAGEETDRDVRRLFRLHPCRKRNRLVQTDRNGEHVKLIHAVRRSRHLERTFSRMRGCGIGLDFQRAGTRDVEKERCTVLVTSERFHIGIRNAVKSAFRAAVHHVFLFRINSGFPDFRKIVSSERKHRGLAEGQTQMKLFQRGGKNFFILKHLRRFPGEASLRPPIMIVFAVDYVAAFKIKFKFGVRGRAHLNRKTRLPVRREFADRQTQGDFFAGFRLTEKFASVNCHFPVFKADFRRILPGLRKELEPAEIFISRRSQRETILEQAIAAPVGNRTEKNGARQKE